MVSPTTMARPIFGGNGHMRHAQRCAGSAVAFWECRPRSTPTKAGPWHVDSGGCSSAGRWPAFAMRRACRPRSTPTRAGPWHADSGGCGSAGRRPASAMARERVDQGRHLPRLGHGMPIDQGRDPPERSHGRSIQAAAVVQAAGRHPRRRRSVSTKALHPTFEGPVRQRLGTRPKRLRNAAAKLLG